MRKGEKGAALIISIIVFSVLTILAAAFITLAFAEETGAIHQEKKLKAYYVARSGAEAAAAAIISNSTDAAGVRARDLLDMTNPSTVTGSIGSGSFNASVEKYPDGSITILSTGAVNDTAVKAKLRLEKLKAPGVFNRAVYSGSPDGLDLGSVTVEGDVESAGPVNGGDNMTGDSFPNSSRHFEPPEFGIEYDPLAPASIDGIIDSENGAIQQFSTIAFENDVIEFRTGGSDLYIYTDILDLKCGINVTGGGRLYLYIRSSASFQTPETFNNDPDKLLIHLADGAVCDILANGTFNAYIYGPNAHISLGSQTHFFGSIIGGSISYTGSPLITYVPIPDDVDIPSIINYRRLNWE